MQSLGLQLVPSPLISVGINSLAGLNLELGGVYGIEQKSGGYDNLGAMGLGLSGLIGTHGVMLTSGFGITKRFFIPVLLGLIGPSYLKRYDHAEHFFGGRLTLQVFVFGLDFGLFYRIDDDQLQDYLINFGIKWGP